MTAVLLTPPKIQFLNTDGTVLANGKVYFYTAGTSTPKDTYNVPAATLGTENTNPVVLDSAGMANIWISGSYKVIVKTSADVVISTTDNVTGFSTSLVSAAVTDSGFVIQNSSDATKQLKFSAASIGTGTTTTITVPDGNSTMATTALAQTFTNKTLTSPTITTPVYTAEATIASATTTDLASGSTNYVSVSGTTTITSFGSNAATTNPVYFGRFTGALTLTHNATSLILPGAANITTAAGDAFIAKYEGSGNWRVTNYTASAGNAGGLTTIASGSFGAVALLDITSIPQTYRGLILSIKEASNTVATRALTIEVGDGTNAVPSVNNGSSYTQIANTTITVAAAAAQKLWTNVTQTAAQVTSCRIEFLAYQSGPVKAYRGRVSTADAAGSPYGTAANIIQVDGVLRDVGTNLALVGGITTIRITWDNVATGVFDGGTYALYGVS